MFKQGHIPRKIGLLYGGFILVLILCHYAALDETLTVYREFRDLKRQTAALPEAPQQWNKLQRELGAIDKQMGSSDPQAPLLLLHELTAYCARHNLVLRSVPAVASFREDGVQRSLQTFQVEAPFKSLLKLVAHLENHPGTGRIISVVYRVNVSRVNQKKRLIAEISVQNLSLEHHES